MAPETPRLGVAGRHRDEEIARATETMQGLSGKQVEAFHMVMSRMERLEKENQELMQILLQMQDLLTQSQNRNHVLTEQNAKLQARQGLGPAPDIPPQRPQVPRFPPMPPVLAVEAPGAPRLATAAAATPRPPAMSMPAVAPLGLAAPARNRLLTGLAPETPGVARAPGAAGVGAEAPPAMLAPETPGAPVAPTLVPAPPPGAAALALAGSQPVTSASAAGGPPEGDAAEEAPWKRQRRRRKPGTEQPGAEQQPPGKGLEGYHEALLGV